jgi:hypothetical protein
VRAPRPIVVIVALMALALINIYRAEIPNTDRGFGQLVGLIVWPAVIALIYTWWYRRKQRV